VAEAEALTARFDEASARQAIDRYLDAMAAWDRQGNKSGAARAAQRAGQARLQLGLIREALTSYGTALSYALETPDRLLESDIRSDTGTAAAWAADPGASGQCQQALELARRFGGVRETARATDCLGETAYFEQDLEGALAHHRQAEGLWRQLGDDRGLAQTLMLQGYAYSDSSRFDQARICYRDAQSLWKSLGDEREQAIAMVAEARLGMRCGEYQEALNLFNGALTRLEAMGNAAWRGSVLTGLGELYFRLGDVRAALQQFERSVEVFKAAGLDAVSIDVLMSLGQGYLALGQDTEASDRLERALQLADKADNARWRAWALRSLGGLYIFRRQSVEAERYLQRSRVVQQGLDDPRLAGETLASLGEAQQLMGNHQRAAQYLDEALALSRTAEDRVGEARIHFGLAKSALGLADLARARRDAERAIALVESLRSAVEHRDLRVSYFASVHEYYELHVDVLMQLSRIRRSPDLAAKAFEASERARARSLLESLAEAAVDLRAGVAPDLLQREQVTQAALDDWAVRRRRLAGRKQLAALAQEYRTLEDQFAQIQAEIRSRSPRYAGLVQPRPLDLRAVQDEVLDPGTLLLEYALGEDRSYLWAVTSSSHTTYEIGPRSRIEAAARRVRQLLTARLSEAGDPRDRAARVTQADADYWREAAGLSEMLLAPVGKLLAGKRIVVVADGALQYLPFAALPEPGGGPGPVPLLVSHEIVSLPSASVLAILRRETGGRPAAARTVAVLADPVFEADDPRVRRLSRERSTPASLRRDPAGAPPEQVRGSALDEVSGARDVSTLPRLAATRQEAEAIASSVPNGQVLRKVDFAASRATAMSQELAHYRIVHFATHGVMDSKNPGMSGIALSMFDERGQPQDGYLRLHDIYALRLPADLVVLSACDTALGKAMRGEGLVGMVRGFMYAGARRVVASLWKVDSEATSELMGRFYREMLTQGRTPAAALREAQLAMRQQARWHQPYYWAAFVLQGEWH
jgi:CHAT domain-containing protein/tetratricopeptide (TPR) repeat protein